MTDDNGLYYMRARYYNVNIKRFINQDVVHGSINVSQSLNRYSYVQGNPIKLTDPFGLSPLGKINWSNVGHSALNILGCIKGWGWVFDSINAIWYACEGDYGMAALSLISALSDTGNMIAFGLKSTKFARVGQYIGAITQLVSNAATFTQAAISGLENAKAIFRNAKNGKLLSIDTASNVAALGLNLFTTIVSGKGAVTSGKNIKKMIGTDVGNKWGNKANNKPLLECNLQFFADKSGSGSSFTGKLRGEDVTLNNVNVQDITLKKRSSSGLSQLRSEFNTSVRKDFLMDMGKQTEYLRSAGFTEADILKIQNGYVPTGWQVHHKIPLDGGGTNDFSNMVLIQNEPYHKVLTNYQNSVMKDMNEGDIIVVAWPQPNGNIYPITH